MNIQDFDFFLPPSLIAQHPLLQRSQSRLLHLDRTSGRIKDLHFPQLLDYLRPNDLLVFNNTRVIPARLYGKKLSGGQVEILLERIISSKCALSHVRSNKRIKLPMRVELESGFMLTVVARHDKLFEVEFDGPDPILAVLEKIGHMPLPPYIDRADELADKERYQTIYACAPGAIAAPTAGLHFDEALLNAAKEKGVDTAFVTLHVGAGTFQPVKVDNIIEHKMHSEWMEVNEVCCQKVFEAKKKGGRVIAVGTTSVRALESAAQGGCLQPFVGDTAIFIYPGYSFKVIDGLLTNFHLPKSTLLMLVSALAGRESILNAYQHAIREAYRFFSYGDAMLIL